MMILFIVPPYPNRVKEYLVLPSLEICILSQNLKNDGHDVKLIDMKIGALDLNDLYGVLPRITPDIVLIDDDPRTHCNSIKIVNILDEVYGKRIDIALRGEIASFIPEKVMRRNPRLDYVIRYDDDFAFINIIEAKKGNVEFSSIKNIGFRNGNDYIITKRMFNEYALDSLPMPDRKIYDISKYLLRDSETIVRSSRGCPSNCLFCIKSKYSKFSLFSMSRFCDEIEQLLDFGFTSFFFSDDTFAFSDRRLLEFAEEVERRNLKIKWTSNIRVKDISEFKIKLMKELGAYRVFIGIETANEDSSRIIGKNLYYNEILEKTSILHNYAMEFHASFILGNPGDTEKDIELTIDLVKSINPTLVTFNLLKVYPGLDLYEHPEKYGIIIGDEYWFEKDTWSQQVVASTKDLSVASLEKWSKRCLFEFIRI
ncbi:MAG: radical SAM protein [Leptospirales bacterium]|nr:radical SAM protein [Leptospirales bacterium]MCL2155514.1 radical SAM protein [Leptospirales bacterium]